MPVGRAGEVQAPLARRDSQLLGAEPAGKRDLIPGQTNYDLASGRPAGRLSRPVRRVLRTAARAHGALVIAETAGRSPRGWTQQRRRRPEPTTDRAQRGARYSCTARCVDVPHDPRHDRGAHVGPDLTHLASRHDHRRRHAAEHARQSRRLDRRSAAIKPGNQHAADASPPDELQALLAYLESLNDDAADRARPRRRPRPIADARRANGRSSIARGADRPGFCGWLCTAVDHKTIGSRYIVTAFMFFLLGGARSALMRLQLSRPENTFSAPTTTTRSSPPTARR